MREVLAEALDDIERATILNDVYRFENIQTINSTDELLETLDAITAVHRVEDLEQKGINKFFRGTSIGLNGEPYVGNLNTINYGTSSSVDPLVATIFGIQAKSDFGGTGVLIISRPGKLENVWLNSPNNRVFLELEVIMDLTPVNYYNLKELVISIDDAKNIIYQITGYQLPSNISGSSIATQILESTPRMTKQQIEEFYQHALKL